MSSFNAFKTLEAELKSQGSIQDVLKHTFAKKDWKREYENGILKMEVHNSLDRFRYGAYNYSGTMPSSLHPRKAIEEPRIAYQPSRSWRTANFALTRDMPCFSTVSQLIP